MANPFKEALAAVGAANDRLGELDTKVSHAIQQIEQRLRAALSTRIAIVIRLPNEDEMVLAFAKLDGKWGLTLEGKGNRAPLLSAPRHIRSEVFTAGCIERLIREAPDQIDQQIAEREVAIKSARGIIATLEAEERRRG